MLELTASAGSLTRWPISSTAPLQRLVRAPPTGHDHQRRPNAHPPPDNGRGDGPDLSQRGLRSRGSNFVRAIGRSLCGVMSAFGADEQLRYSPLVTPAFATVSVAVIVRQLGCGTAVRVLLGLRSTMNGSPLTLMRVATSNAGNCAPDVAGLDRGRPLRQIRRITDIASALTGRAATKSPQSRLLSPNDR